ncbi:MAG TPA: VTT domain-containing protein [Coxiellaceae bacterium]|nr:VTT domain-containing protein [Coxiellaceae bacterium]
MSHHFHVWIEQGIRFLHAHPYWGMVFAFLISFGESLPLIGTVIPGSITMTAVGALIGSGILPGWPTIFCGVIGAFIGDLLGFEIGTRFGSRLENIWPFRKHRKLLTVGQDFFNKHGGKSVIIGRFVGPVRSAIPMIAGMMKLALPRFLLAAIPSAILWAVLYMLPGILIGALSLEFPPEKASKFIFAGLLIIVVLWFIFWLIQRFFIALCRSINEFTDWLWSILVAHKPWRPFVKAITNKSQPSDHHQLTLLIFSVLFLLLFSILFWSITSSSWIIDINRPIFYLLQSFHTRFLNAFFIVCTLFGDKFLLLIYSGLIAFYLLVKKRYFTLGHWIFIVLASFGSIHLLKHFYFSPRPEGILFVQTSSSFPSGHTLLALTLLGFTAFLTAQQLSQPKRYLPYLVVSTLITLIAVSRLYLGAHWVTDVMGSLLLGAGILLITVGVYRRSTVETLPWGSWLLTSLGGLLALWITFGFTQFKTEMHNAIPFEPEYYTSIQAWWEVPHQYTPLYRPNRFGTPMQPFNVQWATPLLEIKSTLQEHGWQIPADRQEHLKSAIQRFTSPNAAQQQPILPWLYQGRQPILFAYKTLPHSSTIVELRLWDTRLHFTDARLPLFIGIVNYHRPERKLLSFDKSFFMQSDQVHSVEQLEKILFGYTYKTLNMQIEYSDQPNKIKPLHWSGQVLLIQTV